MKKIIVIVMVLALSLGGCAGLKPVTDFLCNPTDAQKAEAAAMLAALDAVQAAVGAYYPPITFVKASAVLTTIQSGGCFLVNQLQSIFDIFDQAETTTAKKLGKQPEFTSYPALRKTLTRAIK